MEPEQYVAIARMVRRYPAFADVLKRYPARWRRLSVRLPRAHADGVVAPVTYTHHDIFTVQEVFGREDYRAGDDLRVVVDIGSNIGISALYFLTRNRDARCYLYEPVPRNVERLRANLTGLRGPLRDGRGGRGGRRRTVQFTVEPFGRYGGIGVAGERAHRGARAGVSPTCSTRCSTREGPIDLLKIDTEGAELETVRAIRPDQLDRIETICFETSAPYNPDPGRFAMRFACETCRLEARGSRGPSGSTLRQPALVAAAQPEDREEERREEDLDPHDDERRRHHGEVLVGQAGRTRA